MSKKSPKPKESKRLQAILKAIADPTRREVFSLLVMAASALTISDIAIKFKISRQAITRHIKVLESAELVKIKVQGRESFCEPIPQNLKYVNEWVNEYTHFWNNKLDKLGDFLS